MGTVPAFPGGSDTAGGGWLPCSLLSVSVLGASSPKEAVVTAFQLIPFVQGSISILDILIFFS